MLPSFTVKYQVSFKTWKEDSGNWQPCTLWSFTVKSHSLEIAVHWIDEAAVGWKLEQRWNEMTSCHNHSRDFYHFMTFSLKSCLLGNSGKHIFYEITKKAAEFLIFAMFSESSEMWRPTISRDGSRALSLHCRHFDSLSHVLLLSGILYDVL